MDPSTAKDLVSGEDYSILRDGDTIFVVMPAVITPQIVDSVRRELEGVSANSIFYNLLDFRDVDSLDIQALLTLIALRDLSQAHHVRLLVLDVQPWLRDRLMSIMPKAIWIERHMPDETEPVLRPRNRA